ncbi:MAG TPA: hypothetical protein VLF40_00535 [Candidatus Saccharimonadales bacterium]|nr:hypothetical protein [Candidatus Saccharimonadales bacterium]
MSELSNVEALIAVEWAPVYPENWQDSHPGELAPEIGRRPVPYIRQVFVPGGLADEAYRALNRREGLGSENANDGDAASTGRGIFSIVLESDNLDRAVVVRGDVSGMKVVASALAEAAAKRGIRFVNALGGAAVDPMLEDYQPRSATALLDGELEVYCATGQWPDRFRNPPDYPEDTVYAVLHEFSGGLTVPPGAVTLEDIYTDQYRAYLQESREKERAETEARVRARLAAERERRETFLRDRANPGESAADFYARTQTYDFYPTGLWE